MAVAMIDEALLKDLVKSALVEALEERRVRSLNRKDIYKHFP